MAKYKPTKEDIERIKRAAAREGETSLGAVLLEPGYRWCKTNPDAGAAINIATISQDPTWNDTDLSDYGEWSEFRNGVELTDDGRGIIDFYIRKRGDPYKDLLGNLTIEISEGKLSRIYGYGGKPDYFNVREAG